MLADTKTGAKLSVLDPSSLAAFDEKGFSTPAVASARRAFIDCLAVDPTGNWMVRLCGDVLLTVCVWCRAGVRRRHQAPVAVEPAVADRHRRHAFAGHATARAVRRRAGEC